MQTHELLTSEEVCRRLGVMPSTIYSWVCQGRLKVTKVGRLNRFTPEALVEFLEASNESKTPANVNVGVGNDQN